MPEEEKQLPATILPFTQPARQEVTRATEKIEMQRATAEVYASHQRAIQYPRDTAKCVAEIETLCDNIYFASDALYAIPNRGEGLKVQTMKTLALIWGNIDSGTTDHGSYGDSTQMEAWAIDLEKNFKSTIKFTVAHKKKANQEIKDVTDPDDILLLCKSRASKEVRNAIKGVIPDWVQDHVVTQCKRKMHSEVRNVQDSWIGWQGRFKEIGVVPHSMLRYVNKQKPDQLTVADIVALRLVFNTAQDDVSILDYAFPERDKSKTPVVESKPEDKKEAATELPKPSKSTAKDLPGNKSESAKKEPTASSAKASEKPADKPPEAKVADPKKPDATVPPQKSTSSTAHGSNVPSAQSNTESTTTPASSTGDSQETKLDPKPPSSDDATTAGDQSQNVDAETEQSSQDIETFDASPDEQEPQEDEPPPPVATSLPKRARLFG